MKSLILKKGINIMEIIQLKEELHQIIDRIEDNKILEATYTLLEKQDIIFHTTARKPLTQREFEAKIDEGEHDIQEGKVHTHDQVKEHFGK